MIPQVALQPPKMKPGTQDRKNGTLMCTGSASAFRNIEIFGERNGFRNDPGTSLLPLLVVSVTEEPLGSFLGLSKPPSAFLRR